MVQFRIYLILIVITLNLFFFNFRFSRFRYPDYDVIGDPEVAKTAGISTRYSENSLYGILLDIHLLSLSDHLVCTFSSQVCRVAYEIMQTYNVDATSHFTSLDDVYYYGGQNAHSSVVSIFQSIIIFLFISFHCLLSLRLLL